MKDLLSAGIGITASAPAGDRLEAGMKPRGLALTDADLTRLREQSKRDLPAAGSEVRQLVGEVEWHRANTKKATPASADMQGWKNTSPKPTTAMIEAAEREGYTPEAAKDLWAAMHRAAPNVTIYRTSAPAPAGDGMPIWHNEAAHNALLASSEPAGDGVEEATDDGPCTDCYDTGVTIQTERPCSCGAAALSRPRAAVGEPFPQPQRRDGKPPCGECRLPVGETCDICGAR